MSKAIPVSASNPLLLFEQSLRTKGRAEGTIENYEDVINEFLRVVHVKKHYTRQDVDTFMSYLAQKEKTKGWLDQKETTGSYKRFVLAAIKAFFKAHKFQWEFEKEDLPKLNTPRRRWYRYEEIAAILEATKRSGNVRDEVALRVLTLAFSRRKSIPVLMRWDYDANTGVVKMPSIKGGRSITLELDPETNDKMLHYLADRTDIYPAMFPSHRPRNPQGQMDEDSLNMFLKKYCEMAKVESKGLHAFRRGMVTYLYAVKKKREHEIFQMGDWKRATMVHEYIQLSPDYATEGRKEAHPFFDKVEERKPSEKERKQLEKELPAKVPCKFQEHEFNKYKETKGGRSYAYCKKCSNWIDMDSGKVISG